MAKQTAEWPGTLAQQLLTKWQSIMAAELNMAVVKVMKMLATKARKNLRVD